MRLKLIMFGMILSILVSAASSYAEPLKLYVSEFLATGGAGSKEMAGPLQGLLASRLNPDLMQLVKTQGAAELVVTGSYVVFGKMFSLDAQIYGISSEKQQKVFEQGSGQDDVIPALGRLAQKINRELEKISSSSVSLPSVSQALAASKQNSTHRSLPQVWISPPLEGVFTGIAIGRTLADGNREIFVAGERVIRYYLQGKELKLVSEVAFSGAETILTIDTADLDRDGIPEVYVTVMDRGNLISQVFMPKEAGLEKIAEGLPFFFRGSGTDLKSRKIGTQKIGTSGNFYGGILDLEKSGKRFEANNMDKRPENVSIYNSTFFSDVSGKRFLITINEDGYIVVYAPEGPVVWKSSDTYGGSDRNFKQENSGGNYSVDDQYRRTFIEQRMLQTAEGVIIVPRNKGSFNVGYFRSYNKHSLHALRWNGIVLEDIWGTSDNPTYLADFAYDSSSRELILLKVTQKEGMWGKGKSVISIHKIE